MASWRDDPLFLFGENSHGKTKGTVKTGFAVTPPPPPQLFESTDSMIATSWTISSFTVDQQHLDSTKEENRWSFVKNVVLFEGVGISIPPAQTYFIPTHLFFTKKKHLHFIAFIYITIFFIFSLYLYIIGSQYLLLCAVWLLDECVCLCVKDCHYNVWNIHYKTLIFCAICSIVKVEGLRK